ncbi:MAG: hypothetical protein FWD37_06800, partial [Methanomassiliicoccaceae archaeon]|nr:hypothetical protein [Methanomassiliicoccaceae archaeon]
MQGAANEKQPVVYTAQTSSPIVNGETKTTIGKDSFIVAALFDVAEIMFVDVNSIESVNYDIVVRTDDGDLIFSRMGQWAQPFHDSLCSSYNKAMLRAFFVSGEPLVTVKGDYSYVEDGKEASGKAFASVYDDCVALLPPNSLARRIPLCFVSGIEKKEFEITLKVNSCSGDGHDTYTFSKLGHGTDAFANAIEKQIRALQERTLHLLKEVDPSLTTMQLSKLIKMMPNGTAAPLGDIASAASSFKAAADEKLTKGRAGDSYNVFKELCTPDKVWVGFRKSENEKTSAAAAPMNTPDGATDTPENEKQDNLCWMIAPSPDERSMTVEFAEADTATFVYRTDGNISRSAAMLNRSLEAIKFKREVIRLTDEELLLPENADYRMAAKFTSSLRFIRSNFAG